MTSREVLQMIQEDAIDDVDKFNGQPLTGKLVAEMHANTMAMIQILAREIQKLLPDDE